MARFIYSAKKGPEKEVGGYIEAESKKAALHKLTEMGYFPISIHAEGEAGPAARKASFRLWRGVGINDLSVFTRQLSDLLEAGLPILSALSVIQKQTMNRYFQGVIGEIRDSVQDGKPLSVSLKKHPRVFSGLYASMVKSGEEGGNLEGILLRLAEFQESQEELNATVRRAMAYPALMAAVGTATIFLLMIFVIPRIVAMFQELNQALPLPTVVLLNISYFIRDFWWALAGLYLLAHFAVLRIAAAREGKLIIDRIKLGFPVMGQLILKAEIARFARTLSTLLASGVPILEAMSAVIDIMENEALKRDARLSQKEVREGSGLAKGLEKSSYFPAFAGNMIAVGEESGRLENALLKIALSYEREAERSVKILTSLLEPVMILTMGLVIGFIVIAMLLPIFDISFVAQ